MGFSFRLHKIKCLTESDESSAADEPYVLVTAVDLAWPGSSPPPSGPPAPRTFLYGKWTNFDQDEELVLIGEPPCWQDPPERVLTNAIASQVFFVVSVVEQDHGSPAACRELAHDAAVATLPQSVGASPATRASRMVDDVNGAIGLYLLDDHVGTMSIGLDSSDVGTPLGSFKDKVITIDGSDEGKWELTFRLVHHRRVSFPDPTHLAAVTRSPDKMEIWGVASNGLVHGNWFEGRWH